MEQNWVGHVSLYLAKKQKNLNNCTYDFNLIAYNVDYKI